MSTSRAPVVVGFDGSPTARQAVRYAADEARTRGCDLRVVAADETRLPRFDEPSPQEMLAGATGLACEALSPDRVFPVVQRGAAGSVLFAESTYADLLVIGRGKAAGVGAYLGSVATEVVAAAACPVLVIGDDDAPHVPHTGPVVVGVDIADVSQEALEEAFFESVMRGRELVVLYAWHPERFTDPSDGLPLGLMAQQENPGAEARLAEILAPWQAKHPSVPVTMICRRDSAAKLLLEVGSAATMVIVGSRGRGAVAGLLLGSVGRALLRRAACPVLIARRRTAVRV